MGENQDPELSEDFCERVMDRLDEAEARRSELELTPEEAEKINKTLETREAPTEIELLWSYKTKEPMISLVQEIEIKTGEKSYFPVGDLGHNHRGLETFPDIVSISGLEDAELYATGWNDTNLGLKARIDASQLLGQLAKAIEAYLNSGDKEIYLPEAQLHRLKSFKRLAEKSAGIGVGLEMVAREPENPQFELEAYKVGETDTIKFPCIDLTVEEIESMEREE